MSQELELVRRSWDAWERGDMEAIFAFYDPDIVWDFSRSYGNAVLSSEYHGHDGVRRFFREWAGSFDGYYARAEEFIDAGGGRILVRAKQGGRSKETGVEIDSAVYWQVYRVRDGRAVRVELYSDESQALEAVGLSE